MARVLDRCHPTVRTDDDRQNAAARGAGYVCVEAGTGSTMRKESRLQPSREELIDVIDRVLRGLGPRASGNEESMAVATSLLPYLPHAREAVVDALVGYFARDGFFAGMISLSVAAELRLPEMFFIEPELIAMRPLNQSVGEVQSQVELRRRRANRGPYR